MSTTIESLLDLDSLLTTEDLELRTMVRQFGEQRLRPHIAEWFETGEVPVRDLAVEIGKLGLLGMHLEGYGCGGSSATAYGLVCQELEAVDSGLRSLVSVQGSLAMFAIHRWGSEEQREQWLPGDGRRRADRLLRADGTGLRLQPRRHADDRPPRRIRLDPQRIEDVDHQRLDRRRGDRVGPRRRRASSGSRFPRRRRASAPGR